jgi:hypothetical protein
MTFWEFIMVYAGGMATGAVCLALGIWSGGRWG